MKNSLFDSAASRRKLNFNPEGFDWAAAIKAREEEKKAEQIASQEKAAEIANSVRAGEINKLTDIPGIQPLEMYGNHRKAFADLLSIELVDNTNVEEREVVINAAYKQVFGNAHLMESERLSEAESQLCSGAITVMEFIRSLAKSYRYRSLFFDNCSNVRAIELNFKHLLGRAPENYQEISRHIRILAEEGFEAEIDSYLDSDEYFQSFGTSIVPYYRGYKTQVGKSLTGYTHSFELLRGASSSDKSNSIDFAPKIQTDLLQNKPSVIAPLSAVPDTKSILSSLEPKADQEPYKDLEIRNIGYVPSDSPVNGISPANWLQQFNARKAAATFPASRTSRPIRLTNESTEEETDVLIRAVYRQIFGNAHLMESERQVLSDVELELKNRQISVKDFIRELANSELYRALFFNSCTNARAIELNFKHLLGRAPDNAEEISEHISILVEKGFSAEIDSYLDSEEYEKNFGSDTVPYYIGYSSQTGKNVAGYNRIFQLTSSNSSSDKTVGYTTKASLRSQLQGSILKKANVKKLIPFNQDGFDLARTLKLKSGSYIDETAFYTSDNLYSSDSEEYLKAFSDNQLLELFPGDSIERQDLVIEAAYKQIFGNAHLMESERFTQAESQLRSGQISVMEFIRQLAKSDRYRCLFLERCNNIRAVQLNFKHLLGRAPKNYSEISKHLQILIEQGFAAEIDSYINSDEYLQTFGTSIVPYYRGYQTQSGQNLTGYNRSFNVLKGACCSDKSIGVNVYRELDNSLLKDQVFPVSPLSTVSKKDSGFIYKPLETSSVESSTELEGINSAIEDETKTKIEFVPEQSKSSGAITDSVQLIQQVLGIS